MCPLGRATTTVGILWPMPPPCLDASSSEKQSSSPQTHLSLAESNFIRDIGRIVQNPNPDALASSVCVCVCVRAPLLMTRGVLALVSGWLPPPSSKFYQLPQVELNFRSSLPPPMHEILSHRPLLPPAGLVPLHCQLHSTTRAVAKGGRRKEARL